MLVGQINTHRGLLYIEKKKKSIHALVSHYFKMLVLSVGLRTNTRLRFGRKMKNSLSTMDLVV